MKTIGVKELYDKGLGINTKEEDTSIENDGALSKINFFI